MIRRLATNARARVLFSCIALGLLASAGCGGGGTPAGSPPPPPPPPPTPTHPPPQPTDKTPIDGEVYYVLSQWSGLQADLIRDSITAGDHVIQQPRSFTDLAQRWAFTRLSGGDWRISNMSSGLCFDAASV